MNDFSLDGCRTRADVDARRELITNATKHQTRAHKFTLADRRTMPVRGADVPPLRMFVAPGALRRVSRIVAESFGGARVDLTHPREWSA